MPDIDQRRIHSQALSLEDSVALVGHLFRDHYDELATRKDIRTLAPDWERYIAAEKAGVLDIIVINVDGLPVGYTANVRMPHIHYKHLVVSNNDVIYLSPQYRGEGVGHALMDATEELAARRGAREVLWHAKPGTTLDTLLKTRGDPVQDIIYSRVLRSNDGVFSPRHSGGGSGEL